MVINDLDLLGAPVLPNEANAPLIVDSDAMLPAPIAPFHRFEAIPSGRPQIWKLRCSSQHVEFPKGHIAKGLKLGGDKSALIERFRAFASE